MNKSIKMTLVCIVLFLFLPLTQIHAQNILWGVNFGRLEPGCHSSLTASDITPAFFLGAALGDIHVYDYYSRVGLIISTIRSQVNYFGSSADHISLFPIEIYYDLVSEDPISLSFFGRGEFLIMYSAHTEMKGTAGLRFSIFPKPDRDGFFYPLLNGISLGIDSYGIVSLNAFLDIGLLNYIFYPYK